MYHGRDRDRRRYRDGRCGASFAPLERESTRGKCVGFGCGRVEEDGVVAGTVRCCFRRAGVVGIF